MIKPTLITWILAVFGGIIFLILVAVQFILLRDPQSQKIKDVYIAKGEDWRDKTHLKYALAFAWADLLVILPLLVAGHIGVLSGRLWGYIIWIVLGVISIYFSIIFWVLEKEYAYPAEGPFAYYTYVWGFYLYWGIAAVIYSILQLKVL